MKEERKRQKQLESNFEEEYFEDHGGEGIQPVCEFWMRESELPDAEISPGTSQM